MAEYYKGTVLASPIVRGSSGDTYGTHHSVLGVGGFMEVKTITERNAIPVDSINNRIEFDGISSGQRRLGMMVRVLDSNIIYHLHPKFNDVYITMAQWNVLYPTNSAKVAALASNSFWYPLISTTSIENEGSNISKIYSQYPHTFIVGDVIGYSNNAFVKVSNSTALTIEPLGIISVSDYDIDYPFDYGSGFTLTFAGNISTTEILDVNNNQISGGTVYYLSSTAGKLTTVKPTTLNVVNKPMLVGTTNYTNGIVLQYRGLTETATSVSHTTFNAYTGNTKILLDKSVTGATNIGFFSGKTGIQSMFMATSQTQFQGLYTSLYNYYYRDTSGYIRLGAPSGQSQRRGYLSNFTPKKSWVYNYKTSGGDKQGWIFVNGDISQSIGLLLTSYQYPGIVFSDVEFSSTGGDYLDGFYSNGYVSFDVNGSFSTGSTYNIGGPVYNNKSDKTLRLRTLLSTDQNRIKITYDDAFIYFSGGTLSGGTGVFSGITSVVNSGTGIGVATGIASNTLYLRSIVGSGDTVVTNINDTLIINSLSTTQTYNLSSPAVCNVGGITQGTILTGKTAFQLFEDILVPVQYPTLTNPNVSTSVFPTGTYEVGCILPLSVTSTFNAGCINPQYSTTCSKRTCGVTDYIFTGSQVTGSYSCTTSPVTQTVTDYIISAGTQTWSSCAKYLPGVQPYDSKGNVYSTPLVSGYTSSSASSLCGIYPWFWGNSASSPTANQTLIDDGNKCMAGSTGSILVTNYNVTGQYIWFAIPSTSTTKTKWQGSNSPSNCGTIPGDLWNSKQVVSIDSPSSCWTGVNYDIYTSKYATSINYQMTFNN